MEIALGEGNLQRQLAADNLVHLAVSAETSDYEDHTFAGIMFDIQTHKLPAEYFELQSIWLRGDLGPITVWSTPRGFQDKHESQSEWTLHYQQTHQPSPRDLQEMRFTEPLRMMPGATYGIYAHSAAEGDDQIVYDNQRSKNGRRPRDAQDLHIDILPGMAHLSDTPFSGEFPEGFFGWWGLPWRRNREFVGRLTYGVRWLLWNLVPEVHSQLPALFRNMVWAVMMSRHPRAAGSLLHHLESDMVFYILNKVQWWESDAVMEDMRDTKKATKRTPKKKAKGRKVKNKDCEEEEEEEEEDCSRRAQKRKRSRMYPTVW